MANNPNILVFDSGVGGLSIVEQIRHKLPTAQLTYLADNALFPYGLLSEQKLIERACTLINNVSQRYHSDLIVIACNSASTLVLPILRKQLSIPIVGVVPAIKPAEKASLTKVIGLLATPGTIQREYTDELIADFAPDCKVIRFGSSKLVELVEKKLRGQQFENYHFEEILKPFRQQQGWDKIDTMVLACTHFPLAQRELSALAPEIDHWVDSGEAIARRVESLLEYQHKQHSQGSVENNTGTAIFTDTRHHTDQLSNNLKRFGFKKSVQWN